jgi:hypothetical protein
MLGFVLGSFQRELSRGVRSSTEKKEIILKYKYMAFGLIRVRNLSAGNINSTDKHNARRYETKEDYPENVPFEKREDNFIKVQYLEGEKSEYLDKNESNLSKAISKRLEEKEVKGIKSNSNLAIEYVVGISDIKAWNHYEFSGFVSNTKQWLEDRHGVGSVVAIYSHEDESNPHAHIVVVPIETKTVKWKNTKGSGEKKENRLNTRDYTGGREKLRDLQNDYFNHIKEKYNPNPKSQRMGLEFFRGTKVENQLKEYDKQTNHEIGELRVKLSRLDNELEKRGLLDEILKKEREKALNEIKLKQEQGKRTSERKNLWKEKGTKDNPEIFHGEKEKTIQRKIKH